APPSREPPAARRRGAKGPPLDTSTPGHLETLTPRRPPDGAVASTHGQPARNAARKALKSAGVRLVSPSKSAEGSPARKAARKALKSAAVRLPSPSKSAGHPSS